MSNEKNHITIAKIIRKELKARGIVGKVTARFTVDYTVKIQVYDVSPSDYKSLREFVNDYRYNPHVTDIPPNHQIDETLPKVGYLTMSNNFSAALYQSALDYVTNKCNLPALSYNNVKPNDPIAIASDVDYSVGEVLLGVLTGSNCHTFHYWEEAV